MLPGRIATAQRPMADIVDKTLQSCVADDVEYRSWGADRGGRRILPTLKQNQVDDIHRTIPSIFIASAIAESKVSRDVWLEQRRVTSHSITSCRELIVRAFELYAVAFTA